MGNHQIVTDNGIINPIFDSKPLKGSCFTIPSGNCLSFTETLKIKRNKASNFIGANLQLLFFKTGVDAQNYLGEPNFLFFGGEKVSVYDAASILADRGNHMFRGESNGRDVVHTYLFNPATREICEDRPNVLNLPEWVATSFISGTHCAYGLMKEKLLYTIPEYRLLDSICHIQYGNFDPYCTIGEVISRPQKFPGLAVFMKHYHDNGSFFMDEKPKKFVILRDFMNDDVFMGRFNFFITAFPEVSVEFVPMETLASWVKK